MRAGDIYPPGVPHGEGELQLTTSYATYTLPPTVGLWTRAQRVVLIEMVERAEERARRKGKL
jgi:hypothetical protein